MTYKHCVCQICLEYKLCDEHHVWKRAVWGHGKTNSETEFVCLDCHHIIDEIIKVKENEILKQYQRYMLEHLISWLPLDCQE